MAELWQHVSVLLTLAGIALAVMIALLLCVAYLTYAERKVIAAMQIRRGPSLTGPFGLLQPIADGVKLLFKEIIIPTSANPLLFIMAPILTFALSLAAWAVIPIDHHLVMANINLGILYLFAISSLGVYGIIIAGWASNSLYAFLGAIRSAAQMVSYEVSIGLVIITVLLRTGSMNLQDIVLAQQGLWNCLPLLPMFVVFFISGLAETNRTPFDLPEAEAELVAGYHVEYSSMPFALFFLGEYANMILISAMTTLLFMGGWLPPFSFAPFTWIPGVVWFLLKVSFFLFLFLWVRATLPRYRYDQLMRLGWKVFLPLSLLWVVLTAGFLMLTNQLPNVG